VRQFKDLKPIIKTYTEHGLQGNISTYQKQCLILILPNLLNLDQGVIDPKCAEFINLMSSLSSQLKEGSEEMKKCTQKVISEIKERFQSFETLLKDSNINNKDLIIQSIQSQEKPPQEKPRNIHSKSLGNLQGVVTEAKPKEVKDTSTVAYISDRLSQGIQNDNLQMKVIAYREIN